MNKITLYALGLLGAFYLPGHAHAKPADKIADIIESRMHWEHPAPVAKPKQKPKAEKRTTVPTTVTPAPRSSVERDAAAADKAARDVRFAIAFAG